MAKSENIEEFYKRKFDSVPDRIKKEIGHFNVFRLDPYVGNKARPVPYTKRDYYKITLSMGESEIEYADKVIHLNDRSLIFTNPNIPYKWAHNDKMSGYFCVFEEAFFHNFGDLQQYTVFRPDGPHVFDLTDEEVRKVTELYERMFEEINSDYIHKYDLLRTLVFELLHFAMKMQPSASLEHHGINASQRITMLFQELLERQFPIDDSHSSLGLRSASDFAGQLNVHVNHLNRALRESTGKTTSVHITERILQEAKILLKHSQWNISEIAYALGFSEATHFSNFFKKHVRMSPTEFRDV